MNTRERWAAVGCCVLFLVEALVFFRGVLFAGKVIPWDLQNFHLAHIYIYADALKRHSFPLWDSLTYCGRPFQANIQTETLYPSIALIAWIGRDLFRLLEYNVILHTALAGMFAFRLGRSLGLERPAAVALGSVYQMGAFFAIHAEHMGAVTIAAWLPLAWSSVVELRQAIRLREALILSLAFAMSVFGGLTPLTVIVCASALLLALLFVWVERTSWKLPGAVVLCGAFAGWLSLAQLGPSLQLVQRSIGQYRTAWLKSGGGVRLEALATMLWPNYWGAFQLSTYRLNTELTFSYLYFGVAALALALCTVALSWKNRRHFLFAIFAAILCFAMLGDSTVIGRAAYALLPRSVRGALHPEYCMPAFLLAVAVLSAMGVELFFQGNRKRWILAAVLIADPLAVNSNRIWNAMDPKSSPVMTRDAFEGYTEPVAALRKLTGTAFPPWRFDTVNGAMPWAMYAPVFGIPTANGNDPLALSRLIQARLAFTRGEPWGAYYEPEQLDSPALAMMNVRYLVSRAALQGKLAAQVPGFFIYENPAAFPRFWLADSAATVSTREQGGSVTVVNYQPERVDLETAAPRNCYLATSEANYPGWKAFVDGRPVPIYYTNVAFRGLAVPAGRHRVTMRFVPLLFYWCAALSGAAWLVWLALLARGAGWKFPSKRQAKHP